MISFAEACDDERLLGLSFPVDPSFAGDTWATWRVIRKAMFGNELTADEREVFRELAGHDEPPTSPVRECWIIGGRRGGKDVNAAALATYLATIGAEQMGWLKRLNRGERGVVQILAVDRDQARVCLGYVKACFEQPMFKRLVQKDLADGIELKNGLAIEIVTNDRRRVRGRTVVAVIFDEIAFWRSENTANPDEEVYRAIRPAMATMPGALLIAISSPYARTGLLYKKFAKHFGKPGNVLVVRAPTWLLNPTLCRDGEFLTEEFADDPASAAAEYGAEFRTDVESYVSREAVDAVTARGVRERGVIDGISYFAFVDPSGGQVDSMTLAIAHREGDLAVLDAVREVRAPFSPESAVTEFVCVLQFYGIDTVVGDRYAGNWPAEAFRKHGIEYEPAEKPKSDLYRDLLPALNSGAVSLLDNDRMVAQLCGLERRTARGGRDSIDHHRDGKDDIANAVAGALLLASEPPWEPPVAMFGTYGRPADDDCDYW